MTDIEQKALALVQEVQGFDCGVSIYHVHNAKLLRQALCRAIERHEAFRQEVSEAVVATYNNGCSQRPYVSPRDYMDGLRRFIIDPPVDPLVEAMHDCGVDRFESWADQLRAAIEKRGGKIVWGEG